LLVQRWSIIASAGDIYRRAGHADRAIPAFDRALAMASSERIAPTCWAGVLTRIASPATQLRPRRICARRIEADPSVDTRLLYVSILMDDPAAWPTASQWRAACSPSSRTRCCVSTRWAMR
jgi:hypothetical protein